MDFPAINQFIYHMDFPAINQVATFTSIGVGVVLGLGLVRCSKVVELIILTAINWSHHLHFPADRISPLFGPTSGGT